MKKVCIYQGAYYYYSDMGGTGSVEIESIRSGAKSVVLFSEIKAVTGAEYDYLLKIVATFYNVTR